MCCQIEEEPEKATKAAAERISVLRKLLEGDLDYDTTISYIQQALRKQELDIKFVNVLTYFLPHVVRWRENQNILNDIPRTDAQLLIWLIFSYSNAKKVWNKFVELTTQQVKDAEEIVENRNSMTHMQNMKLEQRLRFVETMLEDNLALCTSAGSSLPTVSKFRGCCVVSGVTCPECLLENVERSTKG